MAVSFMVRVALKRFRNCSDQRARIEVLSVRVSRASELYFLLHACLKVFFYLLSAQAVNLNSFMEFRFSRVCS